VSLIHTIQLSNQLHNIVASLKSSNEFDLNSTSVSKIEFQAIKKIFLQTEKKISVALSGGWN
jgi:hypothetical protein